MSILSNLFGKNNGKTINCPYCQFVFEKIPTRKRKCPNCKSTIYVLKGDKRVKLLTEKDKPLVDAYYKEKKVLKSLYLTGASEKQYENYKSDYFKKLGDKANYDDFIWSFYNYLINELSKKDDFHSMQSVYFEMADIVRDKPDQYNKLRRSAMNMDLLEAQKSEYREQTKVVIIESPDSCNSCKELSKRKFTLSEALKEKPLPNIECTHEKGCRCCYADILDIDIFE